MTWFLTFVLAVNGIAYDPRLNSSCTCSTGYHRTCEVTAIDVPGVKDPVAIAVLLADGVPATGSVSVTCGTEAQ